METRVLNLLEKLCFTQVATFNSFVRVHLLPKCTIYIYIYICYAIWQQIFLLAYFIKDDRQEFGAEFFIVFFIAFCCL